MRFVSQKMELGKKASASAYAASASCRQSLSLPRARRDRTGPYRRALVARVPRRFAFAIPASPPRSHRSGRFSGLLAARKKLHEHVGIFAVVVPERKFRDIER